MHLCMEVCNYLYIHAYSCIFRFMFTFTQLILTFISIGLVSICLRGVQDVSSTRPLWRAFESKWTEYSAGFGALDGFVAEIVEFNIQLQEGYHSKVGL